jgi:hypothetical protein
VAFQWSSPPWAVAKVGADAAPGKSALEIRRFTSLEDYQNGSRQDQHSILVDDDVFVKVPRLDAKDLLRVQQLYKAEDLDFGLRPGSVAIDRGVELANITDGFAGRAPDLGALEAGQPPPIYGPRR